MNAIIHKDYMISGLLLKVSFKQRWVSLDFTPFKNTSDLYRLYKGCKAMASQIKKDYFKIYRKELKINLNSFVAEIWGHFYAYRISLWIKRNIQFKLIQKLSHFTVYRSGTIDCGEKSIDSNRWVWDILGSIFFSKYKWLFYLKISSNSGPFNKINLSS